MEPTRAFTLLLLLVAALPCAALAQQPPLTLTSRQPAPNAKSIPPDTLLHLTFNRPPTLGTAGKIKIFDAANDQLVDTLDISLPVNTQTYTIATIAFHAYPITVSANTATIHPHNNLLTYGKSYYVQIDPNTLADFAGIADKSWTFTTQPAAPVAERYTISPEGTADFATLQGALDAIPNKNPKPTTLLLRKGTYTEIISLVDKSNLTILGEDRAATTLTYANNERLQLGTGSSNRRGVLNAIRSTNIILANLTFRNTTPKGGGQAETIIFKSNSQALLTDLSLYSLQDTLQISSPAYVANCTIEGDVDFMWGTGPCFFQDCSLKAVTNGDAFVVSRNTAAVHGFIYNHCTFDVKPGVTGSWLANNQNYANSEVVLLNCPLSPTINPIAWRGQGPQVHYWEFNSTNLADGTPADVSKRLTGSKQLDKTTDAQTIAQYSDPAFILNFKPALAPILTRQPDPQVAAAGGEALFTANAVGVPTPTYQWSKNGTPIQSATQPTLKIPQATASDMGTYAVTVKNANGASTSSAAALSIR